MDPLSDLLATLRPSGAVFYGGRVPAPWGLAVPAGAAAFHAVLGGPCHVELEGGLGGALLGPGDLALLPRGHAHTLRSAPGSVALPLGAFRTRVEAGPACEPGALAQGVTELVCGELRFEPGDAHPLLDALPPLVVVRAEAAGRVPWLDHTLGFLACEARSGRPGASMVMAHLASVLFIHAVRAHLAEADSGGEPGGDGAPARSVLVALRDPGVAAALGAFHRDPGEPWTVDALARHAGMSRTAFADRFRALVGEPPLTYATRWRMHHAARLLRADRMPLADVAARVGYGSEAAFNRTFKRWMRVPPGQYRRAA